ATGRALEAIVAYDKGSALADDALRWLLARRAGGCWASTKDTGAIVQGIAAFYAARASERERGAVVVKLDGAEVARIPLAAGGAATGSPFVRIGADRLGEGAHAL